MVTFSGSNHAVIFTIVFMQTTHILSIVMLTIGMLSVVILRAVTFTAMLTVVIR
jgi:hypothetical protein